VITCLISGCLNFHCNGKIIFEIFLPGTRQPPAALDFARPAHPIAAPLAAGPTAANPPHAAAADEWDRQTDTVPFHRDPAARTMRTAGIIGD